MVKSRSGVGSARVMRGAVWAEADDPLSVWDLSVFCHSYVLPSWTWLCLENMGPLYSRDIHETTLETLSRSTEPYFMPSIMSQKGPCLGESRRS